MYVGMDVRTIACFYLGLHMHCMHECIYVCMYVWPTASIHERTYYVNIYEYSMYVCMYVCHYGNEYMQ